MSLLARSTHHSLSRPACFGLCLALFGCQGLKTRPAPICPENPVVVELDQERVFVALPASMTTPAAEPPELGEDDDAGALWRTEKRLRAWGRGLAAQLLEAGSVAGTKAPDEAQK